MPYLVLTQSFNIKMKFYINLSRIEMPRVQCSLLERSSLKAHAEGCELNVANFVGNNTKLR